jgi:DNA-binding MarR family transcriptional regulator
MSTNTHQPGGMEDHILIAIRRIIRAVDLRSRELLEKSGLTGPQLAALKEVAQAGTISAGDLAKALNVGQPTVTGILERLERRGVLTRARNGEDRRSVDVAVTEEGKRLLASAPPLLQESFRQRLGDLQEWEHTQILATLQRIAAMMEVEELEASPHLVTGADRL